MEQRTNEKSHGKIGIIIPCFNRPQYLNDCIESLSKANLKNCHILFVDDCSDAPEVKELCHQFCLEHKGYAGYLVNDHNRGVRPTIQRGCDMLFTALNCDIVVVLDCDVVVKPDFLLKMYSLYVYSGNARMVSGINCVMPDPATGKLRNPLLSEHKGFSLKEAVAGQCLMFDKLQYDNWVLPALKIVGNWDHNASIASMKDGKSIAVTVPSVVQHIGLVSAMGHNHQEPDRADDFKFISLPDVTLFGIDSHDVAGIELAARLSQRDIAFGGVVILTDNLFSATQAEERRKQYSKFMLKDLTKHFTTSHVLTIHADGYVLNWKKWDNDWLQYDYIGASWLYKDGMNVGNGGFSLRSKKLCDILATNHIDEDLMHPEDHHICRTFRKSLEDNFGIKFAPVEVADRFSIEAYGANALPGANRYTGQFGFHSVHVDFSASDIPAYLRYPIAPDKQASKPRNIQTWDRPRVLS